jgi:hypothetical protein
MRAVVCLLLVVGCGEVLPKDTGGTCATATECTDPALPFCVNSQCSASCSVSADCTDPAAAICSADGACVGCETNDQCDAAAPVCDSSARSCRGCSEDSECAGGVCIEADGTCVAEADAAFVTMMGSDTGTCTKTAPCETIEFALTKLAGRTVIHILGGTLSQQSPISLTGTITIDGEDTTLSSGNQATFAITGPSNVIIEGVRMTTPPAAAAPIPAVQVTGPQAKVVFDTVDINGNNSVALRGVSGADMTLRRSHIGTLAATTANTVECENSKLTIDQSRFETSKVIDNGTQCAAKVTRTRFESNRDGSVQLSGGQIIMENNLIIHRDGFNDSMFANGMNAGSVIRFNTFINTTALPSDGAALGCDATVAVTSNIFAYNSGHPITGVCAPKFSVFDDVSQTSAGTGNQVTGIDTIFVNRASGDFHLSEGSKARGAAEPGQETMVTSDFEGNPRPSPAGTPSDSGAFEAP